MKRFAPIWNMILIFSLLSCKNDKSIIKLLESNEPSDLIEGAILAGESGNIKFVPYLLKNADDQRGSTNINSKGKTVYQSKMIALKNILKTQPPHEITLIVDTTIINFYEKLWKAK